MRRKEFIKKWDKEIADMKKDNPKQQKIKEKIIEILEEIDDGNLNEEDFSNYANQILKETKS